MPEGLSAHSPLTPETSDGRAAYLTALVTAAPPDVRDRLADIGELVISESNLADLRGRQLRDPGSPSDAVEHVDRIAPGDPGVPVRVHRERNVTGLRPGLISIHGGGYVMGSHLGDDGRFDGWTRELRCVGVSVGYRLAPETPFPGPLEDCYTALRWVHENAAELGVDRDRIGVIGGSAGGGLAAGLALLARDRAEFPLSFQVLNYPMLDDRSLTVSGQAGAPVWGPGPNTFGWRAYLSGLRSGEEIPGYAVPARADDLAGLPPTFIAVGNLDGLLDEDIEYARRLIGAGVPTDLHVFAHGPHGYDSLMPRTAVARRAGRVLEDWMAERLHPGR
jgi:acetyl esterase/lipase